MSIKENVSAIKQELNSEEKFFEKVIHLEYFYKKYKLYIWTALVIVVGFFVTVSILDAAKTARIQEANKAFNALMKDGEDKNALSLLKDKSKPLYELYLFQKAAKESDVKMLNTLTHAKAFAIADLAQYDYAILSDDQKALEAYTQKGIYYKDMAMLKVATTLLKQSKFKKAHTLLSAIKQGSPFYEQAKLLSHYGIVN